jgi:hypothetical protein
MSLESPDNTLNVRNAVLKVSRVEMNTLSANTVTSNLEVGTANLYVDTTTGRVGVGTNAPMGTLDVKGVLNHTQVANVAQITSNSNVVMEYRRSKKLIKYPRIALTANSDRGYVASASSEYSTNYQAWKAFDNGNDLNTDSWEQNGISYSTSTGYLISPGTEPTTNNIAGQWVQLELPYTILLSSWSFRPLKHPSNTNVGRDRAPQDGYLFGSTDGSTWSVIENWTDRTSWVDGQTLTFNVTTSTYYKYFRLVWTRTRPGGTYSGPATVLEISFFGLLEYDPEAHGTDVVLHTTPNVPNTDFSNVYYDGQDYTSMPATVADKSGNGVTGTPSGGVGFDSEYKAFTFDEAGDYIALDTGKTGNYIFSVSLWFKSSGNSIETLFHMNGDYATNNTVWIYGSGTSLSIDFVDNAYSCDTGKEIADNMWHHASFVYNGNGESGRDIYLDGIHLGGSLGGSSAGGNLNLTSTSSISRIGALNHSSGIIHEFKGSIANFRLFNRALSADEIWELYAYQKEYFGVSPDVMTLKAGRLGIGTSEPRAVLDVRGDIRGGCPVFFQAHATHPSTATTLNAVTNPIPFNTIVHNKGGGLQSSGVFTCPLAGYYYIVWWFMSNLQNQTVYTYLTINGSLELNGTPQSRIYGYSGATGDIHNQVVAGGTVYMNVGDELRFVFAGSTYMYIATTPYNSFTGFYISS